MSRVVIAGGGWAGCAAALGAIQAGGEAERDTDGPGSHLAAHHQAVVVGAFDLACKLLQRFNRSAVFLHPHLGQTDRRRFQPEQKTSETSHRTQQGTGLEGHLCPCKFKTSADPDDHLLGRAQGR